MPIEVPCKDCDRRHVGCFSVCGEYKAFRAKIDKAREYRRGNSQVWGYNRDSRVKIASITKKYYVGRR